MKTCGIIAPEYVSRMTFGFRDDDRGLAECIMPRGHHTPHRFKTPDGKMWDWEYDYSCGCESCREDDDGMCCLLNEVKSDRRKTLKKGEM